MSKPFISVVMPVFNGSQFVEKTLQSVLDQTEPPEELIIVDDGSRDNTVDLIRSFMEGKRPIVWKLIERGHEGPGAARNCGVREAQGEWIAFLDSDDLWVPEKLERLKRSMETHSETNVFSHSVFVEHPGGRRSLFAFHRKYHNPSNPFAALYETNYLVTSALCVKRSLLLEAGLFDESLPAAQDYEMWLRMAKRMRIQFLEEPLGVYKVRPNNISSRIWRRMACETRVAWKHLPELRSATRNYLWYFLKRLTRIYATGFLKLAKGI